MSGGGLYVAVDPLRGAAATIFIKVLLPAFRVRADGPVDGVDGGGRGGGYARGGAGLCVGVVCFRRCI
jgi:hypothetical protein